MSSLPPVLTCYARDSFTCTDIAALSLYLWFPTFFKYEDLFLTSIVFTDPQMPIFVAEKLRTDKNTLKSVAVADELKFCLFQKQ